MAFWYFKIKEFGSRGGIRTPDRVVNSHLLCQLSYPGISRLEDFYYTPKKRYRVKLSYHLLSNAFAPAKTKITDSATITARSVTMLKSGLIGPCASGEITCFSASTP